MDVVASSVNAASSVHCFHKTPPFSIPQASQWSCLSVRIIESRFSLTYRKTKDFGFINRVSRNEFSIGGVVVPWIGKICFCQCTLVPSNWSFFLKRRKYKSVQRLKNCSVNLRKHASVLFVQLVGVMLVMSVSSAYSKPSWALTEENLLFLEAWRTIDRAYIDKTFNGQSWFKYREVALRNEPMNNREETYMAIRKMLATLDDPFTRFLEPEKFRSLRSGNQGTLTGVGLSIGYPTKGDMPPRGLVVISSCPGGPAYRAGVLSGDVILAIDDTSTENMGLYDAAERLQWVFPSYMPPVPSSQYFHS